MADRSAGGRASLSPEQRAALERRVRNAASSGASRVRIPRRANPAAPAPLSSAQQRLWVLDQLVPGNSFYNVTRTLRIEGPLDREALARAFEEIARRHESLRTTFESRDGQPFALVADSWPFALSLVTLEHHAPGERESAALALAREDAERPFDLARGPLLRATLLRLSPETHVLHVTMHHIVTDGWSMEVFLKELSVLYGAFSQDISPALDPLPVQYADFCHWQREWLQTEAARAQVTHWAERLRGAAPLELQTDHPRPTTPTFRGTYQTRLVPQEVLEKLRTLTRAEGATLFMGLLAAFEIFLQRHTGQEDISIATPIAGRTLPELEGLIGFFANTVIVRGDLSGNPTAREVIRRVRETALDAYAHQDVPLEKLVEVLRPERSLSQNPIAQVLCVLQNAPASELTLAGARVIPIELLTHTARFDLELHATETAQGLSCTLIASSELFDGKTVERLLARFAVLLKSIAENPDGLAGTLELLPEAERRRLVSDWNPPARDFGTGKQLQEFFQARAAEAPDSIAVEFEGARLSYSDLNVRANQLAWRLKRLGVGPDVLVAVCLERSLEMVVALLGVLKAGGAYVPLDPAYPAERLAFMLEDSRARVLVTVERLEGSFAELGELQVCLLDRDSESIGREEKHDPEVAGSAQDLAYVIYTSGSTGRPKGVLVTHHNVDRLFAASEGWFAFDARDVWTLFHSYAFDFSVWELWGALRYGGRLVVVPQWVTRSPEAFHELLARCEVTVLNQTPSAFRQLIAEDASSAAALRIRLVILGGEALEPGMLRPWFERHGDETPRLINMYGITETTVHVTYHPVSRADLLEPSVSVIGRPIPDLQVHVLDRHLNLCPIGVAGELNVSGAGLARGYLNRPELTREKFGANPFGAQPGDRLYRSGDLGRYLPDGQLQHLGRIDHQVKIRGHRIELGEIESVLASHPEVRDAVVAAREDSPGDRRLVAYVIPVDAASPTASELRAFLKRDLPDYMIPAHFVPLDRLPLTANGKVDLRALPAPDGARREREDSFVAPRTSAEKVLAAIWSQVLKTERVGIHDNFFDLGGDSILSIQIVARANQAGLRLSPRQVFAHQTVADLALAAEEGKAPIAPDDQDLVTGPVPLTPVQRWFLEGRGGHVDHFNQAFLLEAPRDLDRSLLETAVRHLVVHHDALRLRLENEGGEWKQTIVAAEDNRVLTSVDLSGVAPTEQNARMDAAAAEVQASLNTARGPIVRFVSFDLGPGVPGRLLVVIHHLGVDGVSWHILLEDLEAACRQLGAGKEIVLPAKTTSFRKWAELLREYTRSETVARELGYWLERAEGPSSPLPLDHAAGPNTERSARRLSCSLTAEETVALLQEVPSAYRTQINDVLLAALVKAFDPATTSGPLLIDLEGHGREEVVVGVDLSRTVGWFTTIFPVRLDFAGRSSPAEVLKGVKEELRAIPEKGIGYGLLRYLSADPEVRERLQNLPQAEVSFNYLGQFHRGAAASLFSIADGPTGPAHAPGALRRHALQVEGIILDGRLRVDWTYSENLHRRTTIETLAERYVEALRSLIAHCRSLSETSFTPSDFPLAGLKQERLDRILRKLGRE